MPSDPRIRITVNPDPALQALARFANVDDAMRRARSSGDADTHTLAAALERVLAALHNRATQLDEEPGPWIRVSTVLDALHGPEHTIDAGDLPTEVPAAVHIAHVLDLPDGTTQHHRETLPQDWPTCPTCGADLIRDAVITADHPYVVAVPGTWICPAGHAVAAPPARPSTTDVAGPPEVDAT